ncbi:MAG TPA: M23 family metallopeptidase [Microbacteriaceae bacterium]|nr:M23 family metallopeptidase [Microbacteriaceae bacterium]
MVVISALTVAFSTPAEALMTSAQVQARQIEAAARAAGQSQTILANGDSATVSGDSYTSASKSWYALQSGITEIEDSFVNNPNGTVQWPFAVGVHIGDRFGSTWGRESAHHGLDFNPGVGAPVQAIADGVVTFAEDGNGTLGVHLMITHRINGKTVTSVYAHLEHDSIRFQVGDFVRVGQVVGNVGDTGFSTGPHLHFEIRLGGIDGPWTDPLTWLRANTN